VEFHFDDGADTQRFDLDQVLRAAGGGEHLYVCGPPAFIDLVTGGARDRHWTEDRIHVESFSPQSAAPDERAFDVKIASTGAVYRVEPGKTVLTTLVEHGVQVPSSCEVGVCGTCVTHILAGVPEHYDQWLTAEERAKNDVFTPCCSRAKTELLLLDL
jgi:vanillate monooxygenase ferredoxin subunit